MDELTNRWSISGRTGWLGVSRSVILNAKDNSTDSIETEVLCGWAKRANLACVLREAGVAYG